MIPIFLLCDEPTGALDSETSLQNYGTYPRTFERKKLVIMVTHNPELAHEYADRIIEFSDGQIRHDSRPHIEHEKKNLSN